MSTRAFWSLLVVMGLFGPVETASAQDTTSQPWLHVQISSDGHDDDGDAYGHGNGEGRLGRHDHGDGDGNGDREDGDGRRGEGESDDERDGHEEAEFNLNINVPLWVVEPLVSLVPHFILFEFTLGRHDAPLDIGAVRNLWHAIADVGDTELLTVDGGDEAVSLARTGDEVQVRVEECDADGVEAVDIRLPVAVFEALLSGDGETLNVGAAVERLADLRGDIVHVRGDDHHVRVWIEDLVRPRK